MKEIRSISGDWLRLTAKHSYPKTRSREQVRRLAQDLDISLRSCYAYIAEERRVPELVEQRFIALFGEPAEDAWRSIEFTRPGRKVKNETPRKKSVPNTQAMTAYRDNWRLNAQEHARALAEGALSHRLGNFIQSPVTRGQAMAIAEGLDPDEALAKHPDGYYEQLETPEDWVVECTLCGLLGSVDDKVQEINGLVFSISCGTGSYKVGAL
jgi:hypothetical protein